MHFAFTNEQAMIAATVRAFFATHAASERTRAAMSGDGIDHELWSGFTKESGLAGVAIPEDFGGAGLGMVELAIVAEAAGGMVAAFPLLASIGFCTPAILAGGTAEQRQSLLPPLVSGAMVASFSLSDEISYVNGRVSGMASYVPHGEAADIFILVTDGGPGVVRREATGVTITPQVTMDQTRPLARIDFDAVEFALLDDGPSALSAALATSWLVIAADALGGAQACLDRTVAYARERIQFGRAIGSFQAVKHRLADMMVEVEQARSAVYWAACAMDELSAEAPLAVHAAKAFACDTYSRCAGEMIQLHGGIGFTWEHDAHLFLKRARSNHDLLGTPDWHREQVAVLAGLDDAA
ncbi:MAG: acyl-CoA dehydrogenase family protein [Sphingomonadales bacterium]